jgi:CRISPR/Cas system-associated exonuclease Cas4 (RecB family)
VFLLGILVLAVHLRWRRVKRESQWLPDELAGATLAYAERAFTARRPWLVARVDRGYRKDGRIWLTELKTRRQHRVYPPDVVELSAQRVAVEAESGVPVSETAYVLTQKPDGSRRVHRVELIRKEGIESLVRRRAAILGGSLLPRRAPDPASCAACAYRAECARAT